MSTVASGEGGPPRGEPELIVITKADAQLQVEGGAVASSLAPGADALGELLRAEGARMEPLFTGDTAASFASTSDLGESGSMATFFQVHAPAERLESLANSLRDLDVVDGAYVKPPGEPAQYIVQDAGVLLELAPDTASAPSATPDYVARQVYLNAAPAGIDAASAWARPGGRGAGISVIDCEWGWQLTHEDLLANSTGLIAGTNHTDTNHGTAVFGEIGGDLNGFGITGIAPEARLGASSFVNQSSSTAIKKAADALSAGDIILLEIHRPGPNSTGQGQKGFIAIEWWPDDFLAIRYAVDKGIVVVEAAGNGWEDLDATVYDSPGTGFPTWWKNPFRLANPSSGAVVVGAGDPPSGTHGRTISPWNQPYVDRARCGFSNWGARVDAQGWGWEVTTAGYGDLQGGTDKNRWYTDQFSGTSSASPVVTGALASVQGILKAAGMPLMTSPRARELLRASGSPQQSATDRPASQRIGNRPNLAQLVPAALRQWVYNVTIQFTFATTASQTAWAYIQNLGWRQIKTGATDGVGNVISAACEAQASGLKVHVDIDQSFLYGIWLP